MPDHTTPTIDSIFRDHLSHHQLDLEELSRQSLEAAYYGSFAVLAQDEVNPIQSARLLHYLHQTALLFTTLKDRVGAPIDLQSKNT